MFAKIWNENNLLAMEKEMVWVSLCGRIRVHWDNLYKWSQLLLQYRYEHYPIGETMNGPLNDFFLMVTSMLSAPSYIHSAESSK